MGNGPPLTLPLLQLPAWLSNPAPGAGGTPAAPTGTAAADAKKLQDMKDFVKDSPTGAAAMKYLDDKKLTVDFVAGGGSYWDGSKVVVDRNESTQEAALTLVHEVNHSKATLDHTGADIAKDSRSDYVRKMLDEEVKGTVDSIKTKNELLAAGHTVSASFPLETQYNKASQDAVDALKKSDPHATPAALAAAGEKAGTAAVLKGFQDGSVVTSNTKEKYPDYYGSGWDGQHPKTP
jgi:hypothetical protein